jgi:hypothetical protein
MDILRNLIALDNGEIEEDAAIETVQWMIDSGYAWTFPGRIGRLASDMIDAGLCHPAGCELAECQEGRGECY